MPVIRTSDRPPGVVYTPAEVTGPMVRLALEPVVRGKSVGELLALRVCDPAIGQGAFLVPIVELIAEHVVLAWRHGDPTAPEDPAAWPDEARRRVAATCIAGVDIDARAVGAARAALGISGPGGPSPTRSAPRAARSRRGSPSRRIAEALDEAGDRSAPNLRVADAMTLDWRAAFPEVFARGGFDVVIGNPPYIRQERLANKPALRRFASYDGVADLYVYFVELAHALLRAGGRYCLIVPNKWLTAAYGRGLRSFLATQHSVDGIADLSRLPLFAKADAFPCIVWGTTGARDEVPVRAARVDATSSVEAALREGGAAHDRARWRGDPWHIDTTHDRALIDRLERRFPPLSELVPARPARGVVTGCNRAFVIDRATRDRLLAAAPSAATWVRPFIKGRDVRAWLPVHAERWILLIDRGTRLDEIPAIGEHLARFRDALEPRPAGWSGAWHGRKPGTYAWYELQDPVGPLVKACAPRLLYQDIQTAPACSLDPSGELVPDTTVWVLPTADRFLLAVLNSPIYGWYARRRFPPALNGAVRPKLAYLRTLPVPPVDPVLRAELERLVERRLEVERERGRNPARGDPREPARRLDCEPVPPCEAGRALDAAISARIADAYELSAEDRRTIGVS